MNSFTKNQRRGQSLVGILVSVFIMIGLAAVFLMPRGNKDGERQPGTMKRSMDMATEVELNSNINQIQQMIGMHKSDNDGKPPASLEELKKYSKFPDEMFINPLDKKPLIYNPATGTICAEGPGCPALGAAAAPGAANPSAPGANPPAPAAANPSTPGGMTSNIPQPGAGAADAMRDE
jgi:hypothetical protein